MQVAPVKELNRQPARIILVEDELFVRIDLATALRKARLRVVEAVNADEAWAFFEAGELPDMLLTDVSTPGELNGLALARRVRSRFPDLPIIIVSGDPTNEREAAQLGKFVPKPYDVDVIAKLVADIAGKPLD